MFVDALAAVACAILIAAALLKASASFAEVYHFGWASDASWRFSQGSAIFATVVEVVLAVLLWKNRTRPAVWLLAAIVFFGFAVVALAKGIAGMQTCDCFGVVAVKPFYTAALDAFLVLGCLTALAIQRQANQPLRWRDVLSQSALAVAFLLSFTVALYAREAWIPAGPLAPGPIVGSLRMDARQSPEGRLQGNLLLASRPGEPINVLGYEQNCSVRLSGDFPVLLSPTGIRKLPIAIRRPQQGKIGIVPLRFIVSKGENIEKVALRFEAINDNSEKTND